MMVDEDEIIIYVPLHITGFFKPYLCDDPLQSGSIGAGIVIEPGLKCRIRVVNGYVQGGFNILFNGQAIDIKPIEFLLKSFRELDKKLEVIITSSAPIGVGYGVSGSASLAVALGISIMLGMDSLKAAQIAHRAEVEALTGLGDVIAIYRGRELELRLKPGAPGIGLVTSFRVPRNVWIVTSKLRNMCTSTMLTKMRTVIERCGREAYESFIEEPDLVRFFECAFKFARGVGFIPNSLFTILKKFSNVTIGFTVKKGVLMMAVEEGMLSEVKDMVKSVFHMCQVFRAGGGIKYAVGNTKVTSKIHITNYP